MRHRQWRWLIALGLTAALALTACAQPDDGGGGGGGGGEEEVGAVSVIGVWGGGELENFRKVAKGWEDESGGQMRFEGTRDLSAILRARVQGGNPPDVAVLPNPALMQQFREQIKPMDQMVDMNELRQAYSQEWIEQGSIDGKFSGLVVKASPKSTVWYDPKEFESAGYEIPTTYEQLKTLTDRIREDGKAAPWSIGVEAGGASGWPASDWIQEIYLGQNGPEKYDQWVKHEIPWTDPSVKRAFEEFGDFATTEGNVPGGAQNIASTNFEDASYLPFQDPPKAYMYFLGAFAQGFIAGQFPDLKAGEDYDFFEFPKQDEQYKGATTVGGDTIVVFNDNASTRSFVRYLAQGDSWRPWAEAGGFTTPNKGLSEEAYPDELTRKAAMMLAESENVRFDADDLMPAEVQQAFWKGTLEYLQNPDELDRVLSDIESTAKDAYANQQ